MQEEPNYLAHAFKSQYNVIGLATAVGFALLSASALPLLIAAGVQLVALPLVAGSERFQRLIRARLSEERHEETRSRRRLEASEMLQALSSAEFQRYRELEGQAGEIRGNYKGLDSTSRMLLDELIQKLDFLLAFYLRMRHSVVRYEAYFATTDAERIEERIAMLKHEIAGAGASERVRQIKARTQAVLEKRLERYHKALENKQLVDAQTETVQEVLQLLRDQSYSIRDPRSITEQLDGLISSAEETERGVRDLDSILSADDDLLSAGSLTAEVEAELESLQVPPPRPQPARSAPPSRVAPPPLPPPPPPRKKLTH